MSGPQFDDATWTAVVAHSLKLPTDHCEQRFHFPDDVGEWGAMSGQCSQKQCTSLLGLETGLCHACQTPTLHSLVHVHDGTVRNITISINFHA